MLLKNWIVLTSLLLVPLMTSEAQNTSPFPDVQPNHWAYSAMMDLHEKGILVGYPKAYDNSTAEACWKSILKAMERGNEKVLRELMSDEVWNEYTSGKSVRADRLALFRRVAHYFHEHMDSQPLKWEPAKVTAEITERNFSREYTVYHNGLMGFGPTQTVYSFKKGISGWKLIQRETN